MVSNSQKNTPSNAFIMDLIYAIENTKMLSQTPESVFCTIQDLEHEFNINTEKYKIKYNEMFFEISNSAVSFDQYAKKLFENLIEANFEKSLLLKSLENLFETSMIIIYPSKVFKDIKIRSRSLEYLRLIPSFGLLRDYNIDKIDEISQIIIDKKVNPDFIFAKRVIEEKKIPPRKITLIEFKERILNHPIFYKECHKGRKIGLTFKNRNWSNFAIALDAIIEVISSEFGEEFKFSEFQVECIIQVLFNNLIYSGSCKFCSFKNCFYDNIRMNKYHLGIEAPVGAGKTLAYIIGPLIVIAYLKLQTRRPNVIQPSCIIIVPRRDLGLDLYSSNIGRLIRAIQKKGINISIQIDAYGEKNPTDLETRYQSDIVIANIESLKLRIQNHSTSNKLSPYRIRFIIIDEIHLFHRFLGTNTALFLRRLQAMLFYKQDELKFTPMFIGISATVADLVNHMKALLPLSLIAKEEEILGKKYSQIHYVSAAQFATSIQGRVNHLFLKPYRKSHLDGSLVNSMSAILHNNRLFSSQEIKDLDAKEIPKVLVFIDSKKSIRQSKQFFDQVERKKIFINKQDMLNSHFIYNNPVDVLKKHSNLINTDSESICKLCKHQVSKNLSLKSWLKEANKIEYTYENQTYGVLDRCYFYESGDCWYFLELYTEIENIKDQSEVYNVDLRAFTKDSIRSFTHMAEKSAERTEEMLQEDGNLNKLFIQNEIPSSVAFVTPVFEVGVDLSNVEFVFTLRAIRDIVSYKQKVGRGGRDYLSDMIAVTIISQNPKDKQILRTPEMVADPNFIEPLVLKVNNEKLIEAHIVEALLDFFINIPQFSKLAASATIDNMDINVLRYSNDFFSNISNIEEIFNEYSSEISKYLLLIFDDLSNTTKKMISTIMKDLSSVFNLKIKSMDINKELRDKFGDFDSIFSILAEENSHSKLRALQEKVKQSVPLVEQLFSALEDLK